MGVAGEFPKTVMLQQSTAIGEDEFGHTQREFQDVRKCAARVWVRSASEQADAPGEIVVGLLRLLLRLPPREMQAGSWGLTYEGTAYTIVDMEERNGGDDQLVTLDTR